MLKKAKLKKGEYDENIIVLVPKVNEGFNLNVGDIALFETDNIDYYDKSF